MTFNESEKSFTTRISYYWLNIRLLKKLNVSWSRAEDINEIKKKMLVYFSTKKSKYVAQACTFTWIRFGSGYFIKGSIKGFFKLVRRTLRGCRDLKETTWDILKLSEVFQVRRAFQE